MGTLRDLSELHPAFRPLVVQWLDVVKSKGIDVLIVETRRMLEVSAAYYAQGRVQVGELAVLRTRAGLPPMRTDEAAKIITNARPGSSWHNYGLAVDFVPMVDRKPDWKYNPEDPADHYDEIAGAAEALGMSWGGKWRAFHDYPHVEWHPGWTNVRDAYVWVQANNDWQIPIPRKT